MLMDCNSNEKSDTSQLLLQKSTKNKINSEFLAFFFLLSSKVRFVESCGFTEE
jgi:hypothetical protein